MFGVNLVQNLFSGLDARDGFRYMQTDIFLTTFRGYFHQKLKINNSYLLNKTKNVVNFANLHVFI